MTVIPSVSEGSPYLFNFISKRFLDPCTIRTEMLFNYIIALVIGYQSYNQRKMDIKSSGGEVPIAIWRDRGKSI